MEQWKFAAVEVVVEGNSWVSGGGGEDLGGSGEMGRVGGGG